MRRQCCGHDVVVREGLEVLLGCEVVIGSCWRCDASVGLTAQSYVARSDEVVVVQRRDSGIVYRVVQVYRRIDEK